MQYAGLDWMTESTECKISASGNGPEPVFIPAIALIIPTTMDRTMDMIEDYIDSLEEILFSSLSAATPDIPRIRDSFNQLWTDVTRYGPGIPKHIPGPRRL